MSDSTLSSKERVYAVCEYLRGKPCSRCSSSVDTPYGKGVQGCYAVAEETIAVVERTRTTDEPTSVRASNEQLAQALRNLRDVAHREVSPRYSAALDKAFTLADIALGEFDSEGEVSREADVGPGGGVRATHATGSAPSKPGAAEPPKVIRTTDATLNAGLDQLRAIANGQVLKISPLQARLILDYVSHAEPSDTDHCHADPIHCTPECRLKTCDHAWDFNYVPPQCAFGCGATLEALDAPAVTKDAGECGACDKPGEHCANVHGICSRHGGRPHETSAVHKAHDPTCGVFAGMACDCGWLDEHR